MKIKWTKGAENNLTQTHDFIAIDNPRAAVEVVQKILNAIEMLSHNPAMGRVGRIFDTRELIISGTPFIIPYRIKSGQIEIIRIFHGARQWSKLLGK